MLTWRMASLCISPVHAGIMPLSTANSSFILLRLLRSIKLWAVFLAILRPAALVALGCFFLPFSAVDEAFAAPAPEPEPEPDAALAAVAFLPADFPAPSFPAAASAAAESSCERGFIWIILRERVGGGGRANDELSLLSLVEDDRRRALTVSAACIGYGAWGEGTVSCCE